MGSLRRRLEGLEAKANPDPDSEHYVYDPDGTRPRDLDFRVYFKAVERHRAIAEGREPPAYAQEEIEHMRQDDLETAAGGGPVGEYGNDPDRQSEAARQMLDEWEEAARRRLEKAKDRPPERWCEVWGADEDDGVEGEIDE